MITIPSVLQHKNVAVYPDDEDCNLFYAIKTSPEIRMIDNQPVFSGLFWTDKADGSSESVAGLGGGWINFDAHLAVSESVLTEISDKIKSLQIQDTRRRILIKKEKERLGLIAKARGQQTTPEPEVPAIKEVRFGAVNFTEGTVTLLEENGGELIPWSSAGGPASLIGDNNAAFALRLSPTGAAIWYKALQSGGKAISIRYDLKFQLRLPSLEIRAWAGSSQTSEINRKAERVWRNTDQGCSDADVERINITEVTEKLLEEGLMNIEIKKGSSEISDEHVSQLRNMAMKLIEDKVQEIIKSRIHGMTEEERKNSMIQLMTEEVHSFVELRFTQEDVVEWQIAPQGTIMNFLEKVPETQKTHITRLVDLSEHEVETVTINTSVDAPWEEAPFVNAVKINAIYPSADKSFSKVFRKDMAKDVWRLRRPKKDDGVVKYTTEVYFKGISTPVMLPSASSNADINVNIGKIGLVDLQFKPHPNLSALTGKNRITSIQVNLSYKEVDAAEHFSDTLVLHTDKPEGEKFTRILGRIIDAPLQYQVTYYAADGSTIEMPLLKYYLTENGVVNIFTPNPYQDTLELAVEIGLIPDESVKKVVVEFMYEDKDNKFESADRVEMSKETDWEPVTGKIVLIDKTKADFRYRYRIMTDDAIARSAWMEGNGDSESLILPIYKVNIDAAPLQLGTDIQNALLLLQYDNNGASDSKELFLTADSVTKPLSWYIPRVNNGEITYSYELTLNKADGSSNVVSGTGNSKILILRKH